MKKIITLLLLFVSCFFIVSCSNQSNSEVPLDIYGTYELDESNDTSKYITQAQVSEDNKVTVKILMETNGTSYEQTYWIGSVTPPTSDKEPYTWVSVKDKDAVAQMQDQPFFNMDELEFTYDNNQLSYTWTVTGDMGDASSTITMEKVE